MLTSRSQRLWVVVEAIAWMVAIACVIVWVARYVDRVMNVHEMVQESAAQDTRVPVNGRSLAGRAFTPAVTAGRPSAPPSS
jgi:hypothetical protein